jgi:molybdenum cofactor cytidylyltransferase
MTHEYGGPNRDENIGIVLLAAGASSRMGAPKQLLKIEGVSLIRRAAEHALASACRPLVVVLGANADLIAPELSGLEITIVVNPDWMEGMSSSIRAGLRKLLADDSQIQSVILSLADQPNVTEASLGNLIDAHLQTGAGLVAASYSGQMGAPALFSKCYFQDLLQLEGEGGAKKLLKQHASLVVPVDFPEAELDLDTPEDFAAFEKGERCNSASTEP